jgi:uncharacterized protein YegJ (DUF2314 family)
MERAYLKVAPTFHHLHMSDHKQMLLAIKKEMQRERKRAISQKKRAGKVKANAKASRRKPKS